MLDQWYVLKWALSSADSRPLPHPIFPAALQVLREFGGLHISRMYLDPARAIQEADYYAWIYYQWRLKDQLFPLAFYDAKGELMLYAIGMQGRIYGLCLISGDFYVIGETFDEAVENLVLNHHPTLLIEGYEKIDDVDKVTAAIQRLLPTG